jgi:NDP-sugar pyrophosphorylase family protein
MKLIDPTSKKEIWTNGEREKQAFYNHPIEYLAGVENKGLHGWASPLRGGENTIELIENADTASERNKGAKTLATITRLSNEPIANLRAKIAKTGPFIQWTPSNQAHAYLFGPGSNTHIGRKSIDISVAGPQSQMPQQGRLVNHLESLYNAATLEPQQGRVQTLVQNLWRSAGNHFRPLKKLHQQLSAPKATAFIMAAGASTRMQPAVADATTGKAGTIFAHLQNNQAINFIDLHMMNAKRAGLKRVIISLLNQDQASKKHAVEMARKLGMKVQFVMDEKPTGTAGPIQKALHHKGYQLEGKDLVVLSGDGFHAYDLKQALQDHEAHGQQISLIGDARTSEDDLKSFGYAVADKKGKIQRFDEKPGKAKSQAEIMRDYGVNRPEDIANVALANTGVYIFGKDTLPIIRDADKQRDQAHTDGADKLDIAGLFKKRLNGMLGLIRGRNNMLGEWQDIGNPTALSHIMHAANTNHHIEPNVAMVALKPGLHRAAERDHVHTHGLSFITSA